MTLRLEEFTDEIAESRVNVTLTLAAGTGYGVGDPAEATVSIDYPSDSDTQATPTPAPAVSPPAAPSDVSVSATTINSFTVSWTAEAGKTYRVEREAAYLFSYRVWQTVADNLSSGSFTESELPCDLFYVYQVRAKVAGSAYGVGTRVLGPAQACLSSASGGARGVRAVGTPMPQLRIVTDNPTQTSIQIRLLLYGSPDEVYNPIRNMDMFQVDRSERYAGSGDPVFPSPAIREESEVAEFDWGGLECGSSYYFRARGHGNGESDGFTDEWGKWSHEPPREAQGTVHGSTRGCTLSPPPAPFNITASIIVGTGATDYGIQFIWDQLPGAASFKLERSDDDGVTWPQRNDPGYDGHVTTGITGVQHSVSGLVCDNDYVFRISAYGDGSRYQADYGPTREVERYVPITDRSARSDAGSFPCTRPTVSVIPILKRKALLSWYFRLNSTYHVQIRKFVPRTKTPEPDWQTIISAGSTETSIELGLDGIARLGLDDHKQGFVIRVTADGNTSDATSVILVDTPILKARGGSYGTGNTDGHVTLDWIEVKDVLGSEEHGGGTYSFRVRRLSDPTSGPSHTNEDWTPSIVFKEKVNAEDGSKRIEDLIPREVYAIQLIYDVTLPTETTPITIYAARDVYVWPSNRPVTDGNRVASFPLSARLKDAQGNVTKTFPYHICKDTFSFTGRAGDWERLIYHAMGQWQLATDNLITINHVDSPCANYDDVFTEVTTGIIASGHTADIDVIRSLVTGLSYYGSFTEDDKAKNEIILVDTGRLLANSDILTAATFPDLAKDIGIRTCVFGTAFGCRIPNKDSPGSDILLNYGKFTTDTLAIPGVDSSVTVLQLPKRGDAPFNKCANNSDKAYLTVVHEGGHAVGIGGANVGGPHPSSGLVDSIVNPRDMAGCTPNPFDIMAIYALYQTH